MHSRYLRVRMAVAVAGIAEVGSKSSVSVASARHPTNLKILLAFPISPLGYTSNFSTLKPRQIVAIGFLSPL